MNASRTLTFLWTPWSLAISIIAVVLTAAFSFIAWRRSGYTRSQGILEAMRIALVSLVAIIFNQPEIVEEFRPEEKPTVAVYYDASPSMATRDVQPRDVPSASPITRSEGLAALTDSTTWAKLEKRMNVVIQPFSGQGLGTDLHDPLASAPGKHPNLLGIVLASDGDWNSGDAPVQAAINLRSKGIPVVAVPVGSKTRPLDVELLSLDAPTFGVIGKSVRIPFTIDSSLPRDFVTSIKLKTSNGEEISKDIKIAAMGRTTDALHWEPKDIGDFTVTIDVPLHGEETIADNNALTRPISIREEKLRVLVVESHPRWEYRYLRNALSRDPGVQVSCLLFHPGLSKVGGGNADYIKEFPAGLDQLSEYDVVFLGDVGLDDGQLTVEQCRLLKGLVEHQASGLVFMPGLYGRQFSLMETELEQLYPVVLDSAQQGGWGSRTPNHFELTELGRRSLLTKLADTADDNRDVWEGLPGFQWYAPVVRARAGTDVLCVHKDVSNEYGLLPLLVTRTYGSGKVLFMGTDGAWRWRKGVEDKYHYRFWGQVVRWMAYQRNMAEGKTMRLYYSPEQPEKNQTLTLTANVMEDSGEPLQSGEVTARIVAPSGKSETIRFVSAGNEWGEFSGRFTTEEPGKHLLTLACKQTAATLETSFFVQGETAERIGRPARPEVLEEIAQVTRGKVLEANQLDDIVSVLANLPEPPVSVRRVQLWSHPAMAGIVIVLLGAFWIGRKVVGLV